jgi:DNA sulfur modification protein DndD
MKLTILGWSSKGLRCPDVDLSLDRGTGEAFPVSLIQTPNGTGKTTTLKLIRAALDGSASRWSAQDVRSFQRVGSDLPAGEFELRLSVDEKLLTFRLRLDFEEGVARYATQYQSRNAESHDPPAVARRFLREDFIRLFIFDGEYANELFDSTQAEAQRAVDSLFQLHLFKDVTAAAKKYLDDEVRKSGTQRRSQRAVRELQDDVKEKEKHLIRLKELKRKALERVDTCEREIAELDRRLQALETRTEDLQEKLEKAQSALDGATADAGKGLMALLATIRDPTSIGGKLTAGLAELVEGLDRLQLPAETASQWFVELADEANESCVCGRPLGPEERSAILSHKEQYLGTEVHSVLNAIKAHALDSLERASSAAGHGDPALAVVLKMATKLERDRRRRATAVEAARSALAESGTDEERQIEQERSPLAIELAGYNDLLRELEARDGRKSISAAQDAFDKAATELHEVTRTADLSERVTILRQLLDDAFSRADESLRDVVKSKCNDRLEQVLRNDPLRIGSVEKSLQLEWQGGASMGQTLAVGYTFLVTLLNEGNHSFPLVVDSPAGPLDHSIRREVAKLIPEMSDQFVAFTISTEREGFVPTLADEVKRHHGEGVQFLTLVRRTPGTEPLIEGAPKDNTVLTGDSALVSGRPFFDAFNLEKEEDAQ